MQRHHLAIVAIVVSMEGLIVGCAGRSKPAAVEQTELLNITIENPTKLSDRVNQNTASLSISRTGVVAVFYPKPGTGPRFYRTSTDLNRTWGEEMDSPPLR